MAVHIYPSNLKSYVKAGHGDTVMEIDKDIFYTGFSAKDILSTPDAIIYSSFLSSEIENFTHLFASNHDQLCRSRWVGVVLHGTIGFQIYAMIGCLRLIQAHGGNVSAIVGEDIKEMSDYYRNLLTSDDFQIPLSVAGSAIVQDLPTAIVQAPEKINNVSSEADKHPAVLNLERPIYEENQGKLVENNFSKPYWADWERQEPHSTIRANYAGFPLYCNPPVMLVVANMIEHVRPDVVVDLCAYKFGMTAFIAQITAFSGAKVLTVNQEGTDDDAWFEVLKKRPWANHVSKTSWNVGSPTGLNIDPYIMGCRSAVVFVNYHSYEPVMRAIDLFKDKLDKVGFIFHADDHMDMPRITKEISTSVGVQKVVGIYNPPGGTWCSNGMFIYRKPGA